MQLAGPTTDADLKMSPSTQAALIDSLFQDPGPLFAGAVCAAVAAVMTVLKTDNQWLWFCVILLILIGAVRALDTLRYRRWQRRETLTPKQVGYWEIRYQIGAML